MQSSLIYSVCFMIQLSFMEIEKGFGNGKGAKVHKDSFILLKRRSEQPFCPCCISAIRIKIFIKKSTETNQEKCSLKRKQMFVASSFFVVCWCFSQNERVFSSVALVHQFSTTLIASKIHLMNY